VSQGAAVLHLSRRVVQRLRMRMSRRLQRAIGWTALIILGELLGDLMHGLQGDMPILLPRAWFGW